MASLTWLVLLLAGLTCTHAVGQRETIQNLPSIVQVEFRGFLVWTHQCAASLITTGHAITTRTCVSASPADRRLRIGTATSGWGGVIRDLNNIVNHATGDLSVVRLSSTVWLGPTIQTIPIVPPYFWIPENNNVSLAGWGSTAQSGFLTNYYLYRVQLQSKNNVLCQSQHPGRVTQEHLCVGLVGRPGRDFDTHDTGAPIIYQGNLAGVVLFGGTGNDLLPIVSVSIGSYTNWIISSVV